MTPAAATSKVRAIFQPESPMPSLQYVRAMRKIAQQCEQRATTANYPFKPQRPTYDLSSKIFSFFLGAYNSTRTSGVSLTEVTFLTGFVRTSETK